MLTIYEAYPRVLRALELISQGHMTTRACDTVGITVYTFEKMIEQDAGLRNLKIDADRRGRDALAEALLHIDSDKVYGSTDARMAGVISKNIQWYLARKDPKNYGDRVEINHNITADRAIVNALEKAKNRIVDITPDVIEATVHEALMIPVAEDADLDFLEI